MKTNRMDYPYAMVWAALACFFANAERAAAQNLEPEPAERYAPDTLLPNDLRMIDGDIAVPRDGSDLRATYTAALWPSGIVPYDFGPNVSSTNQNLMRSAMDAWESLANVQFVPRTNQVDYVFIRNATFNASEGVGKQGGEQRIWIVNWTNQGTLVHELGHALAYWHEQSRADRDDYVDINWNNICQFCCDDGTGNLGSCDSNFEIRVSGSEHGPYDFASVMHYPACAWSECAFCGAADASCRTIDVLPPNDTIWQTQIGSAPTASYWDGRIMSFLYPEDGWVFAVPTGSFWDGSFLAPYPLFSLAYSNTPTGGKLWLKPGEYAYAGRLDRPMQIETTYGSATIGQ